MNATSGALTLDGAGDCVVTATAEETADNYNQATADFTVTVAKGEQTLADFAYNPDTVTFGGSAPTFTAPTGAQTTLSYAASPAEVCTVNATSGALTLVGPGTCTVTATAAGTDNYNEVAVTATVTAEAADTLVLTLDDIAGDDTVNIAEKRDGFVISGDTGSEVGVTVSVTIGSQSPLTTTSAAGGAWSVSVPPNATYITEPSAMVTMSATKTGFTAPSDVTRTLTVDLTAPTPPTYTAPGTLKVGVAITAMTPSTTATDIASYAATGLPSGLNIVAGTGVITGTPDTANDSPAIATVTVTDAAGNPADVSITFPMVAKGDQTLTDFAYNPTTVTFGDTAPTVTAPTGAQGTLSYAATPAEVCTADATSGALTLDGAGDCVVTATAESTDNYNQATPPTSRSPWPRVSRP